MLEASSRFRSTLSTLAISDCAIRALKSQLRAAAYVPPLTKRSIMSDFNDLVRSIQERQQLVPQLKGFGLAFDLAKAFAAPQLAKDPTAALLSGWRDMLSAMSPTAALQKELLAQQSAIQGLASSLAPWLATSSNAGAISTSFMSNYAGLFGGLSILEGSYRPERFNPFRSLSDSIQAALKSYTEHLGPNTTDTDVEELDDVVATMGQAIIENAQAEGVLTDIDVERIVRALSSTLGHKAEEAKGKNIRELVGLVLAALALIIAFFTEAHLLHMDQHQAEVHAAQNAQSASIEEKVDTIGRRLDERFPIRHFVTTTELHLRASPSLDAEILRLLPVDQELTAAWPSGGWLFVSLFDSSDCTTHTGYVREQYVSPKAN